MAEEEIQAPEAAAAVAAEEADIPVPSGNKRKLDDLDNDEAPKSEDMSSPAPAETPVEPKDELASSNGLEESISKEEAASDRVSDSPEAKRPRVDEEIDGSDADPILQETQKVEALQKVDYHDVPTENILQTVAVVTREGDLPTENIQQPTSGAIQQADLPPDNIKEPVSGILQQENIQQPVPGVLQQGNVPPEQPKLDSQTVSRKIEVPNNKVGVLIGKAGDTIRLLQYNSGARIQITRDSDADPSSATRPVELIGTTESINKAEKLINDVIAEADAGGSPALVARGFGASQTGSEQTQIQVPYEKVGLIIGKGGETIKNLQTRSGARIQVILQDIPEGDLSKERTVKVTGTKKQLETAKEMIKEVMNQNSVRPSSLSGGFSQAAYRPRGPTGVPQWGPRVPQPAQTYQQGGIYPSQTYGGYPQQAPRSGVNAGWDQRASAPVQTPAHSGAYDHYSQGGHATDGPGPAAHFPTATGAAPTSGPGPAPTQANYGYGQPQPYGQPTPYPQSVLPQQSYAHGYDNPKYENQAPSQHAHGGHGNAQPGTYPQQVNTEPSYMQQPYKQPPYGMPTQGPAPQSYGPTPRAGQPGDVPYPGPVPSSQTYGHPQSYPYVSSGPSQQSFPYGCAPPTNDGYNQHSSVAPPTSGYAPQGGPVGPGYTQQGGQVASGYAQGGQPGPVYAQQGGQPGPVYAQQGGQPTPVYTQQGGHSAPVYAQQGAQPGAYGQYPPSQPGYGDQPAQNTANYGYQGSTDAVYNSVPGQAYSAPATGQAGYPQPAANQSYEQSVPQSGYGSHAGTAPVGYTKTISPQPAYNQY